MTGRVDAVGRTEVSLLDPALTAEEARGRLKVWHGFGLAGAVFSPWLLGEVPLDAAPGLKRVGTVAFPFGTHTLTSKRVELLECVRLLASAAEVVLTPALVASGPMSDLEREMGDLLKTAPELEVRFVVEWARLSTPARAKFLRLLRDFPPAAVRIATGVYAPLPGPSEVSSLKPLLPKKVLLKAVAAEGGPRVEDLLAAGADRVETARPGRSGGRP